MSKRSFITFHSTLHGICDKISKTLSVNTETPSSLKVCWINFSMLVFLLNRIEKVQIFIKNYYIIVLYYTIRNMKQKNVCTYEKELSESKLNVASRAVLLHGSSFCWINKQVNFLFSPVIFSVSLSSSIYCNIALGKKSIYLDVFRTNLWIEYQDSDDTKTIKFKLQSDKNSLIKYAVATKFSCFVT